MLAVFRRHQAGITRSLRYSSLQPTKRSYALKASSQRVHTPPEDGQLPNLEEWRELFPLFKPKGSPSLYRPILHNLATAEKLVKGFGIKSAEKPKVVLEAFAGPGTLTRALCSLPPTKVKKIIVLENSPDYLPYLESLAAVDNRVVVRPYDPWYWDSYSKIIEEGLLDEIEVERWDHALKGVHPSHSTLHFVASALPWAETGEALFNQIFRAIASGDWLFKYGAVPFSLVIPDTFWRRAAAPRDSRYRCKLSCMVEATTKAEQIKGVDTLSPHSLHFFPGSPPSKSKKDFLTAATFRPLGYQAMRLAGVAEWDFVLRSLFINKKTPISKALKSMAPGASNMVKYMDPRFSDVLNYSPTQMSIQDWAALMEGFKNWPFAPTDMAIPDAPPTIEKRQ